MIRVIAQYPTTAEAVDAPPTELSDNRRYTAWHRWAWACAFVPFVVLGGYRVLAPTRDWPTPQWLVQASGIALLATLVLALIRYRDDRARDASKHDRAAIIEDSVASIGTVTGLSAGSGKARGVGVEFEGPHGPTVAVLPLPDSLGSGAVGTGGENGAGAPEAGATPQPESTPEPSPAPRLGDPVAIWAARDRPVVLIRYHRGWADDLLAAVHRSSQGEEQNADPALPATEDGPGDNPTQPGKR